MEGPGEAITQGNSQRRMGNVPSLADEGFFHNGLADENALREVQARAAREAKWATTKRCVGLLEVNDGFSQYLAFESGIDGGWRAAAMYSATTHLLFAMVILRCYCCSLPSLIVHTTVQTVPV